MTTLALVLFLAIGGGLAARADDAIQWQTIPAESCQGLWIVPLTFDGDPGGTLRVILDTGAGATSMDPDAIRRVFGKRVRAGKKVRLKNLHAGPLKIRSVRVQTHELDHLSQALGSQVDGILGFPVFKELLLALDYPAGEVRVASGSLPEVDDVTVFRDVGSLRPYLTLELAGQRLPLLIDSGSTGVLQLLESDPVAWEVEPRPLSAAAGYSSIRLDSTGRAAGKYHFGPSILERPVVDVSQAGSRLVGFKVLRHFEWIFDTRHRRIRITPASKSPIASEPYRGTGMALRPRETGFEVIRVFPDTPAAEADLREGDLLTALDGVPIFERGCRSITDNRDSAEQVLTVRRGDAVLEVAITGEVLIP